jgi:hypothetical protein
MGTGFYAGETCSICGWYSVSKVLGGLHRVKEYHIPFLLVAVSVAVVTGYYWLVSV